jgi:protein-S-isoprenylcysteine O-methyltransferase Ste14
VDPVLALPADMHDLVLSLFLVPGAASRPRSMMSSEDRSNSPGVHVPPPLIYLAGFAAGWGLHQLWPIELVPESMTAAAGVTAAVLVTVGSVLAFAGLYGFARYRTALVPSMRASHLITTGVYRLSRNPIYLGFTWLYLGAALHNDVAWTLPFLLVVSWVMNRYVIAREEQHLTAVFGDAYRDYCRRVRRWL